jgi:tryptophanyl-tRNA synthetase
MNPTKAPPGPKRILSGVQPSGKLHIGNYFGAIKQHIALQNEGMCFYFIADYHALTSVADLETDPKKRAAALAAQSHDVALDYLALGLDPDKVMFFRQSDVPEVCELAWIFSTVTGMGLLERAHSYKDKTDRGITPNVGLFTYPVLMAADILIYRSHIVPVGKDQLPCRSFPFSFAGWLIGSWTQPMTFGDRVAFSPLLICGADTTAIPTRPSSLRSVKGRFVS